MYCTVFPILINNYNISAYFIARFFMIALRNGFNYIDILNPIKKTLHRMMSLKYFEKLKVMKYNLKKKKYYELEDNSMFRMSILIILILKRSDFIFKYINELYFSEYIYLKNFYFKYCDEQS